jgi:hypothetical protein
MKKIDNSTNQRSTVFRWVTAGLGTLFIVCALIIIWTMPDDDVVVIVAAAVIGLLGIEALVSAAENRPSILTRLGPLP